MINANILISHVRQLFVQDLLTEDEYLAIMDRLEKKIAEDKIQSKDS